MALSVQFSKYSPLPLYLPAFLLLLPPSGFLSNIHLCLTGRHDRWNHFKSVNLINRFWQQWSPFNITILKIPTTHFQLLLCKFVFLILLNYYISKISSQVGLKKYWIHLNSWQKCMKNLNTYFRCNCLLEVGLTWIIHISVNEVWMQIMSNCWKAY